MPLKRARPIDEVIEIAGVDDYDDLGGREERIERRKKRRSKRKSGRARRLKKDSSRLRREARVTSSRSSSTKRRPTQKKPTRSAASKAARAEAPPSYEEDYEDLYEEEEAVYEDEAWPEEDYDPEDFEDPYDDYIDDDYDEEFEGEFAGRKKRGKAKGHRASRKNWEKPALVGKLRIHAKKGHRAAIRELEDGLYLVAEVSPGKMENLQRLREATLAGDGDPELGALSLIARLASLRAQRLLQKEDPQAAPVPMVPASVPVLPSVEPSHPWYDKSKVPAGVGGAVVTQPGDTMWGIASKHLGNGMKWNQVYLVNAGQLQGKKPTDPLSPGLVLWLPVAPTGNWLSS
jgi:nucleoid-associated protein YgaU